MFSYTPGPGQGGHYHRQPDPQMPFPSVPPPPLPPSMAGAWGSSGTADPPSYMPGGTWQQAAAYNGAFPTEAASQIPAPLETGPVLMSSAARDRHFPGSGAPPLPGSHNNHHHHDPNRPRTASGLEVHAMQRLVSSARTRLVPGHPRMDASQLADERERARMEEEAELAAGRERREGWINSHRSSGGVAYERRKRIERENRLRRGVAAVPKPVVGLDGTFRRTKTPQPSSSASHSSRHGASAHGVPLSQAQTSLLSGGVRPMARGTTRRELKGPAPNLRDAISDGFGMRFQPEQIAEMRLPRAVGAAAAEAASLRTAAGGVDHSQYRNPAAPEGALINGLGDMFQRIKHQYTEMQTHPSRAFAGGGGGGLTGGRTVLRVPHANVNASGLPLRSPAPRRPNTPFHQHHLAAQNAQAGAADASPLRVQLRQTPAMGGGGGATSSIPTPLYAIAGSGAHREVSVQREHPLGGAQVDGPSSPTGRHRAHYSSPGARTAGGGGPNASFTNPMQSPQHSVIVNGSPQFDVPKPSARALQLRQELEQLEVQWKMLHGDSSRLSPDRSGGSDYSPAGAGGGAAARSTKDQVLSRISAVVGI